MIKIHEIDSERMVATAADHINGLTDQEQNRLLLVFICFMNTVSLTIEDRAIGSMLAFQLSQFGCRFSFSQVKKLNDDDKQ